MGSDELVRGNYKATLTRNSTYLSTLDKENISKRDYLQLKQRLNKLLPLYDMFNVIQSKIEQASDDQGDHENERTQFDTHYYNLIAQIEELIEIYEENLKNTTPSVSSVVSANPGIDSNPNNNSASPVVSVENNSSQSSNATMSNTHHVQLPAISLPSFDGSYSGWSEFWENFEDLIHNNNSLSDVQKFHYLKSSLKKDAVQVIQSIKLQSDNYNVAIKLLCERYENKVLIINEHVNAIFNEPSIHRESFTNLRQLVDNIQARLRCLHALNEPIDQWSRLLIYIVNNKLDNNTRREWQTSCCNKTLPDWEDFIKFLNNKCEILRTCETSKLEHSKNNVNNYVRTHKMTSHVSTNKLSCVLCNKEHLIYNCESFLKMSVNNRIAETKRLKLCLNCLKRGHVAKTCRGLKCKKCNKTHNTMLHINQEMVDLSDGQAGPSNSAINAEAREFAPQFVTHHVINDNSGQVLLSTAIVYVEDHCGKLHTCRVLLDSGSQSNFITAAFVKKLGLNPTTCNLKIQGINNTVSNGFESLNVFIKSRLNEFKLTLPCVVLPKITECLPIMSFSSSNLNIPRNITLADPNFNISSPIDLLIGAAEFYNLLCVGQIKLGHHLPVLQKTKIGWIVSGLVNSSTNNHIINCHASIESLDEKLASFWEVDETISDIRTPDEIQCETHFQETTTRDNSGRFIVRIPFKGDLSKLGNSKSIALRRYHQLERKFDKNIELREKYAEFMQEYEDMGHMNKLKDVNDDGDNCFYMPHHAVYKENSTTTKLRVAFDASAKTDTGLSINDFQLVGPTIQSDLFSILIRFRKHTFAFSVDIEKMYRQILLHSDERRFQQILWRPDPSGPICAYQLCTVTYGTASAPFMAVRCLQELAINNETNFPKASNVIKRDFYVDDLLSGSNSENDAIKLKKEITAILKTGGFPLRKWVSNNPTIVGDTCNDTSNETIKLYSNNDTKTLGVLWNPQLDRIQYSIDISNYKTTKITKRTILSLSAQVFDPLGLLAPIIITAKLIIQTLWQLHVSWDESVPLDIFSSWQSFCEQLNPLNEIKIPRHVFCPNKLTTIELHGFADASERAYGACIYMKTIDITGQVKVNLLCAKSKVSPLKKQTLPRLELCAAVLLAKLSSKVINSMEVKFTNCFYWSDSTVTLCWINGKPQKWKTFVGNRVAEIQRHSNASQWRHVKSADNPADLISRTATTSQLIKSHLWWHGPSWLSLSSKEWPKSIIYDMQNVPEIKTQSSVCNVINDNSFDLITKFSSYVTLKRVTAYIIRFHFNCKNKNNRRQGHLSVPELQSAEISLIKLVQNKNFAQEIKKLSQNKDLPTTSALLPLSPFLDDSGILRVGGRLKNSNFNFNKCHPIVLPQKCHLTYIIIKNEHLRLCHCGPQILLASIRERYWPLAGGNACKRIVRECIQCFRSNPKSQNQLMGQLPSPRVNPSYPFSITGIDYCGPFFTKNRSGRGSKLVKTYICLFICFSTKAIHLELTNDLTTDNFLATLRRFISRRGKPSHIYSDNGKGFIGANNELKRFLQSSDNQATIVNSSANEGITWHFIPPRSPHFGGSWEAGIKSTKTHLKRVLGNIHLTFEAFYTILVQIEAILNSRPMYHNPSNPNDPLPITPAHFLIGRPLTAFPEPDMTTVPIGRLSTYQHLQRLCQHFWNRWSREYIPQLQTKAKWHQNATRQLTPGAVVLVKEDNLPPLQWKLGSVVETHPGKDGVTRVVSVKCSGGVFKRAVTKLFLLPKLNDEQ